MFPVWVHPDQYFYVEGLITNDGAPLYDIPGVVCAGCYGQLLVLAVLGTGRQRFAILLL